MNILYRAYARYDRFEDHKRFAILLSFGIPLIIGMGLDNWYASATSTIIAVLLILSRYFYLNRKKT